MCVIPRPVSFLLLIRSSESDTELPRRPEGCEAFSVLPKVLQVVLEYTQRRCHQSRRKVTAHRPVQSPYSTGPFSHLCLAPLPLIFWEGLKGFCQSGLPSHSCASTCLTCSLPVRVLPPPSHQGQKELRSLGLLPLSHFPQLVSKNSGTHPVLHVLSSRCLLLQTALPPEFLPRKDRGRGD